MAPIQRRNQQQNNKKFNTKLRRDKHLREAQVMLEEYAIMKSERQMMTEAAKYLEELELLNHLDGIRGRLDTEHAKTFEDCFLAAIQFQINPIPRANGIPDAPSMPMLNQNQATCHTQQDKQLLHEVIKNIVDEKSENWQNLKQLSEYWMESIANLKLLTALQY